MFLELFGPSKRKADEEEKRLGREAMKRRERDPDEFKVDNRKGPR